MPYVYIYMYLYIYNKKYKSILSIKSYRNAVSSRNASYPKFQ